jgi:hypothetical protein
VAGVRACLDGLQVKRFEGEEAAASATWGHTSSANASSASSPASPASYPEFQKVQEEHCHAEQIGREANRQYPTFIILGEKFLFSTLVGYLV